MMLTTITRPGAQREPSKGQGPSKAGGSRPEPSTGDMALTTMTRKPVGEQTATQPPPEAAQGSQTGQAPPTSPTPPAPGELAKTNQLTLRRKPASGAAPNKLGGTAAINSGKLMLTKMKLTVKIPHL